MKVKDIKNQLNKETGDNTPDVLENVKASPINKLKKDEKNLVAFKKTMATLILAFLLVILVVLSIAIHGLTTQDDGAIDHFTFLSLRLYDGTDGNGLESGNLKTYNFILNENGKVLLAYNQTTNEKLSTPNKFEDILDIINYNGEGTIYVVGASDSPAYARQFARAIEDTISQKTDFAGAKIVAHINNSLSKTLATSSVKLLPDFDSNEHTDIDSINKICTLYLTLTNN